MGYSVSLGKPQKAKKMIPSRKALAAALLMCGMLPAGEIVPAPKVLLDAKRAFLVDEVGDTKVLDQVYSRLKKWGRWQIVESANDADILLILTRDSQMVGSMNTGSVTASGGRASGYGLAVPIISDKRFLVATPRSERRALFVTNTEARISPRYTAGALVNRMKERIEKTEAQQRKR